MTTATNTREAQITIALEVLKMEETGKTKRDIAEEFGVSPRSVARYAAKYEEEAMDLLTGENEPEETTDLKAAFEEPTAEETTEEEPEQEETTEEESADEADEEPEVKEPKPEPKVAKATSGKRGGKPRNGRVALVKAVIGEMEEGATVKEVYAVVAKRAEEEGLPEITKGSFVSIIHQIMKKMGLK